MPSGICASIEPSEYKRIGHTIDHAGFEDRHRRMLLDPRRRRMAIRPGDAGVRLGECRWRAGASPRRRRIDGPGAFRLRPGIVERHRRRFNRFGGAARPAAPRDGSNPAADGSLARASARSRSFREEDENSKLRLGLTGGAGAAGSAGDGASARPRSRAGGLLLPAAPGRALPALSAAGWSWPNRKPSSVGRRIARCSAVRQPRRRSARAPGIPEPSCRAIFFSSRTTDPKTEHDRSRCRP